MTEFASQTAHIRELTDEETVLGFANCSGYGMTLNSLNLNAILRQLDQKYASENAGLLEQITATNTLIALMMQSQQDINVAHQEQIDALNEQIESMKTNIQDIIDGACDCDSLQAQIDELKGEDTTPTPEPTPDTTLSIWEVTDYDAVVAGETPSFTLVNQDFANSTVSWAIDSVEESGTEGDRVIRLSQGSTDTDSGGMMIIKSGEIPKPTLSSALAHKVKIIVGGQDDYIAEFEVSEWAQSTGQIG